jgi:hypothetical protein
MQVDESAISAIENEAGDKNLLVKPKQNLTPNDEQVSS